MEHVISFKRGLAISALTLLLMIGPTSCWFFERCPPTEYHYYKIHGLDIQNFEFTGEGGYPLRRIQSEDTIKWENYFMKIGFYKTIASNVIHGGGQNLFALSCDDVYWLGSAVGIDTLYLVTQQDYNGQYLKNDTLNQIIELNYRTIDQNSFDSFLPLSTFIQENNDYIKGEELEIKTTEPPTNDGEYDFKLIFILNNGESFEKVSDKVNLII